ncbi:MAG TPA: bifunctional precorrin-2 dehydrogenase/sirohydrochlorin ferrochelatase [Gemmataceae bacterium]|nr:bifunctional precorrin-2 dehydrogenase/sirohydrochlorin ferrochelatase [Gemmataceae bacterium]
MFPVMLDLAGRQVVVVGYGPVGRRKAAAALAAGAAVRVVDPLFASPDLASPDRQGGEFSCHFLPEHYRPDHLDGASLVFACATPEVNARVVTDAKGRGVWVNSASDPGAGNFFLPAVAQTGGLTIAVSTGGASPGLARRIREKLEVQFDAAFAEWVKLLDEIRAEVLASVADPDRRRELLDDFADWPWLERLRAEGIEAVRTAMRAEIRARRPG